MIGLYEILGKSLVREKIPLKQYQCTQNALNWPIKYTDKQEIPTFDSKYVL